MISPLKKVRGRHIAFKTRISSVCGFCHRFFFYCQTPIGRASLFFLSGFHSLTRLKGHLAVHHAHINEIIGKSIAQNVTFIVLKFSHTEGEGGARCTDN